MCIPCKIFGPTKGFSKPSSKFIKDFVSLCINTCHSTLPLRGSDGTER